MLGGRKKRHGIKKTEINIEKGELRAVALYDGEQAAKENGFEW